MNHLLQEERDSGQDTESSDLGRIMKRNAVTKLKTRTHTSLLIGTIIFVVRNTPRHDVDNRKSTPSNEAKQE